MSLRGKEWTLDLTTEETVKLRWKMEENVFCLVFSFLSFFFPLPSSLLSFIQTRHAAGKAGS
jgi:hypothetical protein